MSSIPPNDLTSGNEQVNLPASSPLQSCPHCEALIDTTEREPLETIACPGCSTPLTMGGELAGFQLVEVAGRGGMGVVYRAYDPSLDRYVAIKLLRKDHSSDRKIIAQLETEATITASINDPNVVRVYATGFDRGRFFLAMELVDQGSLDDLIRLQTRVAEIQVLEVAIQIARGLRAAHQHGLIHRDIKPGNILFADAHTAKIVDFGLALFMNQIEGANAEIWGTPYYVAPEKLDNGAEDFRSDIYSLGGTLFHALAGRPPFEAATATLVALKHLKSQAVSLQAFAPWVSNPTAHIINKSLAKNPADRYQSYDELINNLEYAFEQLSSQGSAPQGRARVVLETADDHKTWTWVVLGMAVVIIGLIVGFVLRPKAETAGSARKDPSMSVPGAAPTLNKLDAELKAVVSRDPKAVELLQAAATNGGTSATDRTWAQLLEGVVHTLAGSGLEARNAFNRVPESAARMKDQEVAGFLTSISQKMANRETISMDEAQTINPSNHESLGLFLHGINLWQSGQFDDGLALLRKFRQTTPSGANAWISELKPLATILVEETLTFNSESEKLKNARNPTERVAAATILKKLGSSFTSRVEGLISPFAAEITRYQDGLGKMPGPAIYKIINKHTGKALEIGSFNRDPGAGAQQWDYEGAPTQLWELIDRGEGTIALRNIFSGHFLDVPHGTKDTDVQLQQWLENLEPAEKWRLEPQDAPFFFIRSTASEQVVAVYQMNAHNGNKVTQWNKPGSADHFWRFDLVGTRAGEWIGTDIGNVSKVGESMLNGKTLHLTTKSSDLWGNADHGRFAFQPTEGDFEISARLAAAPDTGDFCKAGLMVRDRLRPESPYVSVLYIPRHGMGTQTRPGSGDQTTDTKRFPVKFPVWMKLVRTGNIFTTSWSEDGKDWKEISRHDLGSIQRALVGFVATSFDDQIERTVTFDEISFKKR